MDLKWRHCNKMHLNLQHPVCIHWDMQRLAKWYPRGAWPSVCQIVICSIWETISIHLRTVTPSSIWILDFFGWGRVISNFTPICWDLVFPSWATQGPASCGVTQLLSLGPNSIGRRLPRVSGWHQVYVGLLKGLFNFNWDLTHLLGWTLFIRKLYIIANIL